MNSTDLDEKIAYIVKHNRFPLTKMDKVSLGIIFSILIALASVAFAMVNHTGVRIVIPCLVLLFSFVVYNGYLSSLSFKKIPTGFDQEQNRMLVVYCLGALNIKAFKNEDHKNVFVCFVQNRLKADRQEIYIIAKDDVVLIHTNKEKDDDAPPGAPDFVDRIGGAIYHSAKKFKAQQRRI